MKGKESLGWEYGSTPSSKSVRCDLEQSGDGDCFLGQGVYSDGICEEVMIKPVLLGLFLFIVFAGPGVHPP